MACSQTALRWVALILSLVGMTPVLAEEPVYFGLFDRYTTGGRPVPDNKRERRVQILDARDSFPMYLRVRKISRPGANVHHDYTVHGLDEVLVQADGQIVWYGTQIQAGAPLRELRMVERLKKMKSRWKWPWITVQGPEPMLIECMGRPVEPEAKETVGVFLCVNDNDSDIDGMPDHQDPRICGEMIDGDPDLVPFMLSHPQGLPVVVSVDDPTVLGMYETRSKTYGPYPFSTLSELGMQYPPYAGFDDRIVYIEGRQPGSTFLRIRGPGGFEDAMKVTVLKVDLVPDWNRDLKIDDTDRNRVTESNPFRFWINDDQDSEGEGAANEYDQPGSSTPDASDYEVNSLRDLLDFYPVFVDLKATITLLGTDEFTYYLSFGDNPNPSQGRFIYTDLSPAESGSYLTNILTAQSVAGEDLHSFADQGSYVYPHGMRIPNSFLDEISAGKGIILIEHATGLDAPLYVRIVDAKNNMVLQKGLALNASKVESMFTHKDLRGAAANALDESTWQPDWDGTAVDWNIGVEPPGYPDFLTNEKAFIFVHGYNNNFRASRGGNAEMFKRLFWSGSRAKYYAVSWYGYHEQFQFPLLFGDNWKCPNYQGNVINALKTASALAQYVNGLPEVTRIIAAHSLGSMVVSASIQDSGLVVNQCFMINAAVSAEAYSAVLAPVEQNMVHVDWGPYTEQATGTHEYERLFCFNWYQLFQSDSSDSRNTLTWSGRFVAAAGKAYHFWSAGDETFFPHSHQQTPGGWTDWDVPWNGERAWAIQEKRKGRELNIPLFPELGGSYIGGWGFNGNYFDTDGGVWNPDANQYVRISTPEEATEENITDNMLQRTPFFRKGNTDTIQDFQDLFDPTKTDSASDPDVNAALLATFVPAKQLAMGGRADPENLPEGRRFEMQEDFDNGGWYDHEKYLSGKYWNHGEFKTAAMPYVCKFYSTIVEKGQLSDE